MPRNAGGVYTLPAGNPVVTGTVIQSTWANPTLSDVANELTNSLDRAGRGSMTAPLKLADGTAAAPGLTFNTEPTSGIYRSAAGAIAFSILTTLTAAISAGQLSVVPGTAAAPSHSFIGDLNTGWSAAVADTLVGSTAGLNRFQIGPNGNVTVAAPSAGTAISVTGILSGVAQLWSNNGGTASLSAFLDNSIITFGSVGTTPFALATNGSSRLTITSAGNVTIAAPSSGTTLALTSVTTNSATVAAAAGIAAQWVMAGNGNSLAAGVQVGQNAAGNAVVYQLANANLVLGTNSLDRVTIAAAGNVTIAAPSSGDTANFGQVAGSSAVITSISLNGSTAQWSLANTSNTANSDARIQIQPAGTSAGDPYIYMTIPGATNWAFGVDNSDSDTWKIDSTSTLTTATNRFNVTTDGRIYGNAIHNNAGAVTGTTNQYFASGTYTPTATAVTNVTGVTANVCKWIRVGNVVTVSGSGGVQATAGGAITTNFTLSLPIASNFVLGNDAGGTMSVVAAAGSQTMAGLVTANTASDILILDYRAAHTTNVAYDWSAQYEIL